MLLLDANALIEAHRLYYSFDIAPGFWVWLESPSLNGKVGSVRAIYDEIKDGKDDLAFWVRKQPATFWIVDDDSVVEAMTRIAVWVTRNEHQYRQAALDEFLDSADLALVAAALATGGTVVTRERPDPASRKRVKIPDVCNAFGVPWIDPFTAYRRLGLCL